MAFLLTLTLCAAQALTEDIAALEAEITELEAEITKDTAAKANGETLRGEANTLYGTNKADLEATIQAVADAITALESSKPSMAQTKMVQKALAYVPDGPAADPLLPTC